MLRLEFWHDNEQVWFFQHDKFSLLNKIELALRIIFSSKTIVLHAHGKAKRTVGGREYRL